jgi:hypothetical protein
MLYVMFHITIYRGVPVKSRGRPCCGSSARRQTKAGGAFSRAFGREVPLQPDMTLRADIILEKRSLIEWLLEPLLSVRHRMS